jgi:hypothetical protein
MRIGRSLVVVALVTGSLVVGMSSGSNAGAVAQEL